MIVGPEDGIVLKKFKTTMEATGVQHQFISCKEIMEKFPGLVVPANYVALLESDGGTLKADKCLRALQVRGIFKFLASIEDLLILQFGHLKNHFKLMGGTVKDCEKVSSIELGTVMTVRTSLAQYDSHKIVLCMGPWTGDFLKAKLSLSLPLTPEVTKVVEMNCYTVETKFYFA